MFWTAPPGPGPWPAVLLILDHQEQRRNGGEFFVDLGVLGAMAARGYVTASLSLPGYGHSDGPPDYCGPFTQEAALAALAFVRGLPSVDPWRVALYWPSWCQHRDIYPFLTGTLQPR